MKKTIAALAAGVLLLTGCSDSKESGHTEASTAPGTSQSTTAESAPAPAGDESKSEAEQTSLAQTTESAVTHTQPSEPTEEPVSINAAELVARFDNRWLGLPLEDKVYIFSDKGETKELDGVMLYGASCYDEHEGTLYYMCDYYVTGDGSAVYRWYDERGQLALCPENTVFPRLDPTSQTPQEIFGTAELLYGMFTPGKPPLLDSGNCIEEDGRTFAAIADERLNTKARLLDSLTRYFTDEIISSLMEANYYIREGADGTLYYDISAGGAVPSYIGSTYELSELTEDKAVFTVYSTWEFEAGERVETRLSYTAFSAYDCWWFSSFPGCPEVWSIQSDTAQSVEDSGDIGLE